MKPTLIHKIFPVVAALALGFHLGSWSRQSHLDFWISISGEQHKLIEKLLGINKEQKEIVESWKKTAWSCIKQSQDYRINNAKNPWKGISCDCQTPEIDNYPESFDLPLSGDVKR